MQIVTIFELIQDSDRIVRIALKNFMNWFMPRCRAHIRLLGPFWTVILAHVSAALSHINTRISYNALKIMRTFFSVSNCAEYFGIKTCLSLLSHLQLLFHDICQNGTFILNENETKRITSLVRGRNRGNRDWQVRDVEVKKNVNPNAVKEKKEKTKLEETTITVHILCECTTHIIRVIQKVL